MIAYPGSNNSYGQFFVVFEGDEIIDLERTEQAGHYVSRVGLGSVVVSVEDSDDDLCRFSEQGDTLRVTLRTGRYPMLLRTKREYLQAGDDSATEVVITHCRWLRGQHELSDFCLASSSIAHLRRARLEARLA